MYAVELVFNFLPKIFIVATQYHFSNPQKHKYTGISSTVKSQNNPVSRTRSRTPLIKDQITTYEAIVRGLQWCCVPGSSVSVERLFSRLCVIYGNKRRGRLLPSIVEDLVKVYDTDQQLITSPRFPTRYTQKYAERMCEEGRLDASVFADYTSPRSKL
ncbi:unnamed protein product, partial [Mesorhabditis belari]|uniref:HAT C-terminal dimerisation domain-containing protein n=1 Tax=Mesorhabditis belari TaxID=2138241 RepID=A0AAF3J8S3_9BILA